MFFFNIPIAHIHGGEKTVGSFDDIIRNCITHMSSLHFTCHDHYKKRVQEITGTKKNIFNVGSLSCENITKTKFLSKRELEKKFFLLFGKYNALVTYHPETKNPNNSKKKYN